MDGKVKVNSIRHVCAFSERGTHALEGLAPVVAIWGLISICKKYNYLHMETINKKKSLKSLLFRKKNHLNEVISLPRQTGM